MRVSLTISLIVLTIICQAQINYTKLDLSRLEYYISLKTDSFRNINGCSLLWNDSALYISAQEHAGYLKSSNDITIYENSRKMATPQKRIEDKGRNSYKTTELISVLNINPDSVKSEQELADLLFHNHVKSLINKACLLSSGMKIQGLKVVFEQKQYRFIVVHDIAIPPDDYIYLKNSKLFPYDKKSIPDQKSVTKLVKKYEYHIKAPTKEKHCRDADNIMRRTRETSVITEGGRVYVKLDNESIVKQLIENKNDGFVTEEIDMDDYPCNDSEVHNLKQHKRLIKGNLLQPKYMEDVFKSSFDDNKKYFKKAMGYLKSDYENAEANVYVVKNKRICSYIGPAKICGDNLIYSIEPLEYLNIYADIEYMPPVQYDTLRLKLYYKPGETKPDSNKIEPLVDFIRKEGLVVTKAFINANASIEGSESMNKSIFNHRADYLLSLFEKEQKYPIRMRIKTQENWDLFYKQIEKTKYGYLAGQDTDFVRQIVNDSVEYFRNMLDQERYASVTLFAVTKASREQFKVFAMNDYKKILENILYDIMTGKTHGSELESLKSIQAYLYQMYRDGEVSGGFLKLMNIPDESEFNELKYNETVFRFLDADKTDKISEDQFFNDIRKLMSKGLRNGNAVYNFLVYVLNHYGDESVEQYQIPERILAYKKKINLNEVPQKEQDKINYHYNYLKTLQLIDNEDYSRAKSELKSLYKYILKYEDEPTEIINIAQYYILFGFYDEALDIVKSARKRYGENNDLLILYLKLNYLNFWRESRDSDYYLELMQAAEIIGPVLWCNLFTDPCGLSIQLFNYEPLLKMYCILSKNKSDD